MNSMFTDEWNTYKDCEQKLKQLQYDIKIAYCKLINKWSEYMINNIIINRLNNMYISKDNHYYHIVNISKVTFDDETGTFILRADKIETFNSNIDDIYRDDCVAINATKLEFSGFTNKYIMKCIKDNISDLFDLLKVDIISEEEYLSSQQRYIDWYTSIKKNRSITNIHGETIKVNKYVKYNDDRLYVVLIDALNGVYVDMQRSIKQYNWKEHEGVYLKYMTNIDNMHPLE